MAQFQGTERSFPNNYSEKEELSIQEFESKVANLKSKLLKNIIEKGIPASKSDYSIYTGFL